MSSDNKANPSVMTESKSAKKKKAKAEASNKPTEVATLTEVGPATTNGDPEAVNGVDGNYESPYLKELYK